MSTRAAAYLALPVSAAGISAAGISTAATGAAVFGTLRRRRIALAVTAVVAGLSIPLTGAGSAIASPHPPSLTSTVAATSALTAPVAKGKLDV